MSGRLEGRVALVVGAGQTPGDTVGNGRATAILMAREGARVLAVDRRLDSARETVAQIEGEGGVAQHDGDDGVLSLDDGETAFGHALTEMPDVALETISQVGRFLEQI